MSLKKIIELSLSHGYLTQVNKSYQDIFKIGPTGTLLLENLKTEWLNSVVINTEPTIFYNTNIFGTTFNFAKEICMEHLPFGVAECVEEHTNMYKDYATVKGDKNDFRKLIPYNKEIMICTTFVSPRSSTEFFHQLQRQRRMWWRKFSASPGRYHLTEIQNNGKGENVDIFAKYDWGEQLVESLNLFTVEHPCLSIGDLQLKDGRRKVQAHYVTSQVCLTTMLINTICDAYDEPPFQNDIRPLLRLHRKIAPYKISFAISSPNKIVDLRQLALYLCKLLRAKTISCLYVPTSYKNTLESQWRHYDQLGVPYCVLLKEDSLKNGIVQLRSRETTLYEQIHVSKLVEYVEQLFKNY